MTHVELKNGRYRNLSHMWQSGEDARELIKSLRDDEQVKSQEPGSANGCVLMTRTSGRSKYFTDVTFFEDGCSRCNVPVGTIFCSNQRSANTTTSHSFDYWNVNQERVEE